MASHFPLPTCQFAISLSAAFMSSHSHCTAVTFRTAKLAARLRQQGGEGGGIVPAQGRGRATKIVRPAPGGAQPAAAVTVPRRGGGADSGGVGEGRRGGGGPLPVAAQQCGAGGHYAQGGHSHAGCQEDGLGGAAQETLLDALYGERGRVRPGGWVHSTEGERARPGGWPLTTGKAPVGQPSHIHAQGPSRGTLEPEPSLSNPSSPPRGTHLALKPKVFPGPIHLLPLASPPSRCPRQRRATL